MQVHDSIDPDLGVGAWPTPSARERSRLAKTLRADGTTWGDVPAKDSELAHADSRMTCYACHTSWVTSCFGCHLPMKANERQAAAAQRGRPSCATGRPTTSRRSATTSSCWPWTGRPTGKRMSPARSTCAVLVGSQNGNREWVYSQQQTVSAEGFSGHAFSTYVPHTRAGHRDQALHRLPRLGKANDNNAIDGPAADAGHQLRQLHRPLRLRGRGRSRASRPSSSPSRTSRRRSSAATCTSWPSPTAYRASTATAGKLLREEVHHRGSRRARRLRQGRGAVASSSGASTCTPPTARADSAPTTWRRSTRRASRSAS